MTKLLPDPAWLAGLRTAASQPPLRARVPLWAGEVVIGSVEPEFLNQIAFKPIQGLHSTLQKVERDGAPGWRLTGDVTAGLDTLARALRDAGLAHVWRNEQLAVTGKAGERLGTVERAVVRALGITTHAVHLVGASFDGRVWVQQRALDKPNDPGLWDTLMGGMVAARDTQQQALVRETWEEAGLALDALQDVTHGGRVGIRRPSGADEEPGYTVEGIDWYRCTVPEALVPVNQDGEVARFALLDQRELLCKMQQGEFTLEAALILAAWFESL